MSAPPKKTDCCFDDFKKSIIFAQQIERIMSYELNEKEASMVKEQENSISRKELMEECYSLEESKTLLLQKVQRHYHPKTA